MTINCNGRLLDFSRPMVMGIINVTPDSFYSASRQQSDEEALTQARQMMADGADILDIGAMSSRPGAEVISPDEELRRLLPVLERIKSELPEAIVSIDTVHAAVARRCLELGADMINDISGGSIDNALVDVLAEYKVPYVLMHMQGQPSAMQDAPHYEDVSMQVLAYMSNQIRRLRAKGIEDIIVDPGYGFGKTDAHNFQLMRDLASFQIFDCPVLVGLSRKSSIQRTLDVDAAHALNGTTALHMYLLQRGANILRVHDVKEAKEVVKLWEVLEA